MQCKQVLQGGVTSTTGSSHMKEWIKGAIGKISNNADGAATDVGLMWAAVSFVDYVSCFFFPLSFFISYFFGQVSHQCYLKMHKTET
uniref:Uncharacterized protein n=1 Tax=Arundo donax TaxID=35708 RepID=A0A0A9H5G4_ARUDO